MSIEDDEAEMEEVGGSHADFFDHEPTKAEKIEVRTIRDGTLNWPLLKALCFVILVGLAILYLTSCRSW